MAQSTNTPSSCTTEQIIHEKVVQWLRKEASIQVEEIDYDASLFELGIDSLGAANIAAELEQELNKRLNPEVVYELETIRELAEYLDSLAPMPPSDDMATAALSEPPAATTDTTPLTTKPGALIQHYAKLNRRVNALKDIGLYFFEPEISAHDGAWVVADGKRMLMLGSYEYLGLLSHPDLKQAAIQSIERFGTGHHGARLLCGTTSYHNELEAKLASFMQAEDAIVFSSGYVTNLSVISTLVGRGDCIIGDQWNHASIADGCHASGADVLEFKHNDMESLAERLQQTQGRRTLVIVDAVFSMDGDIIDMPAVVDLCKQYNALLMVDEAHSLGVLGRTGRGIQEHFGLNPNDIDIKMGTLSKTLAGSGGFIAARREVTTYLRHHARGYIFSGALAADKASVAIAALELIEREPERVEQLRKNVERYHDGLKALGFDTAHSSTPIIPIMTHRDDLTLEMTRLCREGGLLVIPVCYPAVPANAPRLRTCVSAIHSNEDIDFALQVLAETGRKTGLIS